MRRQIVSPSEVRAAESRGGLEGLTTDGFDQATPDDYKDKLLKHIPAEAVALYLTLDGMIRSSASSSSIKVGLWVAFALGLVGTPLYLYRLQGVADRLQLSVSTISYLVWVFALGGAFALYGWYEPWIASAILVAFTFMIPVFLGKPATQKPA